MNVFDFDNTIYKGESAFDFFIFCIKRKPQLAKVLFPVMCDIIKYKLCLMGMEEFSERGRYYTETFFKLFDDIPALVSDFWDKHQHKVRPFYEKVRKDDDVIITANVDVLVEEIFRRMNIKNYITSQFDLSRGKLTRVCFSDEKVSLFKEKYGDKIDDFYTDSQNDAPLMELAQRVYIVKGNKIVRGYSSGIPS